MVDPKEECLVTEDEHIRVDDGATSPSSSPSSCTSISIAGDSNKRCTHCNTTTTPLWRGGPAGPKTLCNACGIKHRKKRRAMEMGNNSNIKPQKLKITHKNNNNKAISKKSEIGGNGSGSVVNLVRTETTSYNGAAAMTVPPVKITNRVLKKHSSRKSDNGGLEKSLQSKKIGEEKRAALLLMALSCGSVSRFERKERKLLKELGII